MKRYLRNILEHTFEELSSPPRTEESDLIVFDNYIGEGYGVLNSETTHAILEVAETEGILLDPVYTGRAMWGLSDLIRQHYFKPGSNVVFLHTGGTPALFPYRGSIRGFMHTTGSSTPQTGTSLSP